MRAIPSFGSITLTMPNIGESRREMTPYDEMMSHLRILATKDAYVAQAVALIQEMDENIKHLQNVVYNGGPMD
jgi:RNA processing factor Prp31